MLPLGFLVFILCVVVAVALTARRHGPLGLVIASVGTGVAAFFVVDLRNDLLLAAGLLLMIGIYLWARRQPPDWTESDSGTP